MGSVEQEGAGAGMGPQSESEPAAVGEVIRGYRIDKLIGQGGMGHVYAATHTHLGRQAAVKLLSAGVVKDESVLSRFYYEARVVNDAKHPNIVDIFDFVELDEQGRVACIMEYLSGPPLDILLSQQMLSFVQAIHIGIQLSDALGAVHALGITHRDLKPANIVVVGDLESDLSTVPSLKLLDFGIAKVPDADGSHQTRTGVILGTPAYMAPEQIGGGMVSPKTDIYAMGEILFEMITGRRLFNDAAMQIFQAKLSSVAPDVAEIRSAPFGSELEHLVGRCLDWDLDRRPSAGELLETLRSFVDGQGKAPSSTRQPSVPRGPGTVGENDLTLGPSIGQEVKRPSSAVANKPRSRAHTLLSGRGRKKIVIAAVLATLTVGGIAWIVRGASASGKPVLVWVGEVLRGRPELPAIHPLASELAVWKSRLGTPKKSVDGYVADGRVLYFEDQWDSYAAAHEFFQMAVLADPKSAVALSYYVENLAIWKGTFLTPNELQRFKEGIDYVKIIAPDEPAVYRALSALALAEGDDQGARKHAEAALSHSPDDGQAKLLLAQALASQAGIPAAREADAAAKQLPQLRRKDRVLAQAYVTSGQYKKARHVLDERLAKDPENAAILRAYGDLEQHVGRFDEAKKLYTRAASGKGDQNGAQLSLGLLMLHVGQFEESSAAFQKVAGAKGIPKPMSLKALVGWGRAEVSRGQPRLAQEPVDRALRVAADDDAARLLRAEILFSEGQLARAAALAKQVQSSRPRDPGALVLLARAAVRNRAADEGVRWMNEALANDPSNPELRMILAALYLSFGGTSQAVEVLRALSGFDPGDRLSHPEGALFAVSEMAVVDALRIMRSASSEAQTRSDAHAILAVLDYQNGRMAAAKRGFAKALAADASNPVALLFKAQMDAERRVFRTAESALKRLARVQPRGAVPHLLRSQIYTERGLLGKAEAALSEGKKIDSQHYMVRSTEALLHLKRGKRNQAKTALVAALERRPYALKPRRILFEAGF